MVDLKAFGIPVEEQDIARRYVEIQPYEKELGRLVLEDIVGYCKCRARDAYILGQPEVCSFLSGKSLEEALSIQFESKKPAKDIPDLYRLIEWAKDLGTLDPNHAGIAHEVRHTRNDYGHAYLKVLSERLKQSPGRQPFTDQEARDTFTKAVKVLAQLYR